MGIGILLKRWRLMNSFKEIFRNNYRSEVKDPIISTIIDSIEDYIQDAQQEYLIPSSSEWNSSYSNNYFKYLKKNLYGWLFPGPTYSVASAFLRDGIDSPVVLKKTNHFNLQSERGEKYRFTPQKDEILFPVKKNKLSLMQEGDNLILTVEFKDINYDEFRDKKIKLYLRGLDKFLAMKLKASIFKSTGFYNSFNEEGDVFLDNYPLNYSITNEIYYRPFLSDFLEIPFESKGCNFDQSSNELRVVLEDIGQLREEFDDRLYINTFYVWNIHWNISIHKYDYTGNIIVMKNMNLQNNSIYIDKVIDRDNGEVYFNSEAIMNNEYAFTFKYRVIPKSDEIEIVLSQMPQGELEITYLQYNINEDSENIKVGESFTLFKGADENIESLKTITSTSKNLYSHEEEKLWDLFREYYTTRNKWISKNDIKSALQTYFKINLNRESEFDVEFENKVGRIKGYGYIAPYTLINIRVDVEDLSQYFLKFLEFDIANFLKSNSLNGNFIKVKVA